MVADGSNANGAPGFLKKPDYKVLIEPSPRRIRVQLGGQTIAGTTNALILMESQHVPVYYFPRDDVQMSLLKETERTTFCPFKGEASYWSIAAGASTANDAVWSYQQPFDEADAIRDYLAFYWNKMDRWLEEDEEVFVHPRDPHKRVDVIASSRPVQVVIGGQVIADSSKAHFLFETGLPTRYYLPMEDVRADYLQKSETSTRCPYKGVAEYWSATIEGQLYEDIVWSYPEPVAECPKLKGLLCFFNENVDDILVDGISIDRATTKWSKRYLAETVDGPEHIV